MPNPQQLKERIYALNPELKELTFGCKMTQNLGKNADIYITSVGDGSYIYFDHKGDVNRYHGSIKGWKIIGQPITLNAVLRSAFLSGNSLNISQLGEVFQIINGERVYGHIYDLTKTFDQNIAENEELVTFLLSIIK